MTDDIEELLFNLASNDRLALLLTINGNRLRLTHLAKTIKSSTQECSRHLNRLSDSGYIKKDSDGSFETTFLGRAVLRVLPSLQFLLSHKNYFLSHDLTMIPETFTERIGELVEGKLVGHFNIVLDHIKRVILEGKEFVWLMADQPVVPTSNLGNAFTSPRVPVRLILKRGTDVTALSAAKSILPVGFQISNLGEVGVALAINEKLAGVCFPGSEGKLDFGVGFVGSDPSFRLWCCDLFDHYWKSSEPISF